MNSREAAKLCFGDPGFFDFLAPITNFLRPVTTPLVKAATQVSSPVLNAITGTTHPETALARPEVQRLGQDLAAVGIVAAPAIAAAPFVAPALAGGLASGLGGLGTIVQKATTYSDVIQDSIFGDEDAAEEDPLGEDGDY
jgi:hypothetical protein